MHILLEPGDIIREGDEYWSPRICCWTKVSPLIDDYPTAGSVIYRRHLGPWEAVKHALECLPYSEATTTPAYWDCDCGTDHIRYSGHPYCARCGAYHQDQPGSRLREVLLSLLPK